MAVLTDGQKFGLSSKSQTNKSVLYVKLTDSALRSLEEYLKNNKHNLLKLNHLTYCKFNYVVEC